MKIHILGASCAGSTTLGNALAKKTGYTYLDTDAYFWAPSDIPYTIKREPAERKAALKQDFLKEENVIVGGSLVSWGEEWLSMFDLVVFLYTPHELRMQRLHNREVERYGDEIFTDPVRAELYKQFIDWARGYDDNTTNGRTLNVHLEWLANVTSPVLKIEGDTSVEERVEMVVKEMDNL